MLSDLFYRLRALFRRESMEQELDEEVRAHIEHLAEKHLEAGLPREQALRRARLEFGGLEQVKEECRDARGVNFIETFIQDIRYGLRMLRKNPGFTVVAIITLALGIGANTAIFTLINAVMLKMLPVRNPQELVSLNWAAHADQPVPMIHWRDGSSSRKAGVEISDSFSYRTFDQIRSRNQAFSDFFAFKDLGHVNAITNGQAGLAHGQLVSGDYFSGLGVPAIVGRTITDSDDRAGAPPIAVLGYSYWKSKLGGDVRVVGKAITVNGVPFIVIGVTPPDFFGLSTGGVMEISMPLSTQPIVEPRWVPPNISLFIAADHWWLNLMGRLKPGVTEKQAYAGLDVIFRQSIREGVNFKPGEEANAPWLVTEPGSRGLNLLRQRFSKPLFILLTVVGLVLLIACANVANLLLARAAARQREMAVRLALGAERRRLVRQLITESVMLASAGGLLGLIFAYAGSNSLVAFMSGSRSPIVLDVHPDLRVLAFTMATCLITGLFFGLAPAFRGTRVNLTASLKANGAGWSGGVLQLGLAKTLVISQVSLSLVLLIGAGLFVRTLVNLEGTNLGFNRERLLLFGVDPTQDGYKGARLADFYWRLQEGLESVPGVRSATLSLHLLISGHLRTQSIWVAGYTPKSNDELDMHVLPVGTKFFTTMEIPLLLGRDILLQDDEHAPKVAVINETMAEHFFGNENPVGKQFNWGGSDSTDRVEIVGVVGDAKYTGLRGETPATIYQPFRQSLNSIGPMHFEVRTAGDPQALIPAVRGIVQGLDKNLPLYDVKTQTEQIDELLLQERLFAKLSSFFGVLASLLTCVGLYGLLSFAIVRRTSEISIRMALGAERYDILGMVMRETLAIVALGIAIGIPAAFAATRFVRSMLFGLEATDPLTTTLSALLLMMVAVLAGYLPARRASKVDPMVALRYE